MRTKSKTRAELRAEVEGLRAELARKDQRIESLTEQLENQGRLVTSAMDCVAELRRQLAAPQPSPRYEKPAEEPPPLLCSFCQKVEAGGREEVYSVEYLQGMAEGTSQDHEDGRRHRELFRSVAENGPCCAWCLTEMEEDEELDFR